MALRFLQLALLCLLAQLLYGCSADAGEDMIPRQPDIESTSSWRLGGQDAPGDPEGVSGLSL